MKVLHVVSSYPPAFAYGGPPRSVHNTAKGLVELRNDVTVYTTDAKSESERVTGYENPEVMDGVETYRFRNVSNALSWRNLPLSPGMWRALRRHVNEFDVVHCHEYRSFHTLFAFLGSRLYDVPHVLQPHGSLPRKGKNNLKMAFDNLVGTEIVRSADSIIASSKAESSEYKSVVPNLDPDIVDHIPNALLKEDYEKLPENGMFRQQFSIGSEDNLVLFLGRLHPIKRCDLLIEAISQLSPEDENISLVFVGPDEGDQEKLEAKVQDCGIQDRTYFVGPLYNKEKMRAYVDADVFVLPSEYESFGNVVLEAMACGTPVVITNVCGVAEWVDHNNCHAVQPTSEGLRDGIERVLTDSSSSESIRQYVWENFSWNEVAAKVEEIYKQL